jgi:hypothetical protein
MSCHQDMADTCFSVAILGPMDAFYLSVYTKEDLKIRLSVGKE